MENFFKAIDVAVAVASIHNENDSVWCKIFNKLLNCHKLQCLFYKPSHVRQDRHKKGK